MVRIKIRRDGRFGNKMFQYMFCRYLQMQIPSSIVENPQIPEFSLLSRDDDIPLDGRVLEIKGGHRHCMASIAYLLNQGIYDNLYFDGSVQRLEYYPNWDFCSSLFQTSHKIDRTHLGPDSLIINVRGAEILTDLHPDYGPPPVNFFSQVTERTKLKPVIMGQVGDDFYSNEIRKRFSGCTFLPSVSTLSDFQIIRNATNIVIGVSSFSWLASWLSSAAQWIHMPVSGYYHPGQRNDIDLLPVNDERYNFYEFPVEKWRATNEQKEALISHRTEFRQMPSAEVKKMIT